MKQMRVIYILNATDRYGGATKAFLSLAEGLMASGVQIAVVVPDEEGVCSVLRDRHIPFHRLVYRNCVYPPLCSVRDVILFVPRLLGRMLLNYYAAGRVAALARGFNADLIHTNTSVNDIGYRAARMLGIPHVWHIREYGDRDFGLHHYVTRIGFLGKMKKKDSYTICITKDISRHCLLDGWKNNRVIYDGVLHKAQAVQGCRKDGYFLFAGRLEENKGISDLIEAYAVYAARIGKRSLPLWVAGDTNDRQYKERLNNKITGLNLSGKVHMLGLRSDILQLMQHATSVVVPSLCEGFGFITAEAMFSGTLVMGRDTGGTKEQFDNGVALTGGEIGLRYLTQDELVGHLTAVTKGAGEYMQMTERGQKAAIALYSVETHVQAVLDFYEEIKKRRQ